MSNHLHAIVSSDKIPLSDKIRDFKKFTAKRIIEQILNSNESRKEWMIKKFASAGKRNHNNMNYPCLMAGRNSGNRITMLSN